MFQAGLLTLKDNDRGIAYERMTGHQSQQNKETNWENSVNVIIKVFALYIHVVFWIFFLKYLKC